MRAENTVVPAGMSYQYIPVEIKWVYHAKTVPRYLTGTDSIGSDWRKIFHRSQKNEAAEINIPQKWFHN